jgi:cytochrome c oxidase subunit 2
MDPKGTFWLPEAASTLAQDVDPLYNFVTWVSTLMFIGVVGAMLWFMFRYRRRDARELPPLVHESRVLEAAWIVVPTILVLAVFTWGFQAFVKINTAPPDSYQITVRAKQWLWEYEYVNGVTTAGELHVPVGRPVRLMMSSQDVLHSFFVPQFRVKQDVLPNRYSSVWFEATKPGEYEIFCTEYCGTQHSGMIGKVFVHTEAEFQQWLASQNEDVAPEVLGERVYNQQGCAACHSTDGTVKVGPSFKGLFGKSEATSAGTVTADENYLRESIVNPAAKLVNGFGNVMPASYSALSQKQMDGLIAYIKSLQ